LSFRNGKGRSAREGVLNFGQTCAFVRHLFLFNRFNHTIDTLFSMENVQRGVDEGSDIFHLSPVIHVRMSKEEAGTANLGRIHSFFILVGTYGGELHFHRCLIDRDLVDPHQDNSPFR
jgi:hypothetical protein